MGRPGFCPASTPSGHDSALRWAVVTALLAGVVFAPVTARLMHGIIDAGWVPYWVVVGPLEELTKLLPLLLIAGLRLAPELSMQDAIVLGALGGLGFAIVEFAAVFATSGYAEQGWAYLRTAIPARWALGTDSHIIWGATAGVGVGYLLHHRSRGSSALVALGIVVLAMATHGLNDLYGKIIGPLAIELLIGPARTAGVDLAKIPEGSPMIPVLLVYSAVVSTLVMNLHLWPILIWGLRYSRRADRDTRRVEARERPAR